MAEQATLPGPGAMAALSIPEQVKRAEEETRALNLKDKAERLKVARAKLLKVNADLKKLGNPREGVEQANTAWIKLREQRAAFLKDIDAKIAAARQAREDAELASHDGVDAVAKLTREANDLQRIVDTLSK